MKSRLNKGLALGVVLLLSVTTFAQTQDTARFVKMATQPSETHQVVSNAVHLFGEQNDSVVTTTTITYRTFNDTVVTLVSSFDSIARADTVYETMPDFYHKGHHVQFYLGGGYSTLQYPLENGTVAGGAQALIQLQYAYYFHENWGVSIGASISNLTSHAQPYGTRVWNGVPDTDGEIHDHTVAINRWNERQTIHVVSVPVALQFQHFFNQKIGIFADLGAAPQFAVYNKYKVLEGELEHSAYYPWSRLTLTDMHEFGSQTHESQGNLAARKISAAAFADLGLLVPVHKNIDLYAGIYGYCNVLDANVSDKKQVGWKTDVYPFMEEYNGMYATTDAGKSIPWAAGVKIGVSWHHIPKPKQHINKWYEPILDNEEIETIVTRIDTIEEYYEDTLYHIIVSESDDTGDAIIFNHIYFNLNRFNIRPDNLPYLNEMLTYLKQNPETRIVIAGHACRLGEKKYNKKLSRYRAIMVANWFKWRGIDQNRIEIRSYGDTHPSSQSKHDLKLDRRVEVSVVE